METVETLETTKTTYKIQIWECNPTETFCKTGVEAQRDYDYDGGSDRLLIEFDSLNEAMQHLREKNYCTWCTTNSHASYVRKSELYDVTYYKIYIVSYEDDEFDQYLTELVIGEEDLQPLVEEWEKLHNHSEPYIYACAYIKGDSAYEFKGKITTMDKKMNCYFHGKSIDGHFSTIEDAREWAVNWLGVGRIDKISITKVDNGENTYITIKKKEC